MAQDWDIKPRGSACGKCEKPFEDNQLCFSCLIFNEEGYQRQDYCEHCQEESEKESSLFSSWKGVFNAPPPKAEEPLKKETAESLLRKLIQEEDKSKQNVIFILAVMLERKKILAERDTQTNDSGTMIRVYEHKKTGESFIVADPRLQLDELEQVQQEVADMLGWKKERNGDPSSLEELRRAGAKTRGGGEEERIEHPISNKECPMMKESETTDELKDKEPKTKN
ncbi:hypothetical protein ACFLS1_07360 [Verrucomicrobiota bacterium]